MEILGYHITKYLDFTGYRAEIDLGSDQEDRHEFRGLRHKTRSFWPLEAPFGPQKQACNE